jgi:hypothetical protein
VNSHKVDFPAYPWGNVAVVFSNDYIRDATLIEPTDTGVCALMFAVALYAYTTAAHVAC